MRQRRIVRVLNRLFDRYDLQNSLPPAYQQLKDDSLLFLPTLRGFCLQTSVNLQRVGGLGYPLVLPRRGLNGLLLAPVADVRPAQGSLRMEIHWPTGEISGPGDIPRRGTSSATFPCGWNLLRWRPATGLAAWESLPTTWTCRSMCWSGGSIVIGVWDARKAGPFARCCSPVKREVT